MLVSSALLAEGPPISPYFSLIKIGIVTVLFFAWCAMCQWVDRDTDVVKTKREQWNLIVLSGGIAGLAFCLLLPWPGSLFFVGLAFWILLGCGSALSYVFHRNARVVPDRRVLTWNHLQRTVARMKGEAREKQDKGQRVQITDAQGQKVTRPEDYEERVSYDAAQEFLFALLWRRASDADVRVAPDATRVAFKIDGVPTPVSTPALDGNQGERLLTYLKQRAGLNPDERRRPQVGRIRVGLLGHTDLAPLEVRTSGSTQGERLRLHVQAAADLKRIGEMGLAPERVERLREMITVPTGLVLFSGPPESGVTTTQYAVLREHDAYLSNLYALERRPLLELDNITQKTYRGESEDGVSYARMLQTVLRREPDVVLVGECADRETAQLCARAAEDKKLYVALQAKSAMDTLGQFLSLVEDHKLGSKVLVGVVNQRLIRLLCPACRVGYRPDPAKLRKLNLPADKIDMLYSPPTQAVLDKKGREIICQTCQGSGYVGRTGVFELMKVDENIRAMIADGAPLKLIKQQSRKARMLYLMEDGLLKVIEGVTSMDEIIRGLRDDAGK
jgi:type II secretory ATPase GspE/PulE/Tfp pilus assembly ATPase PilB-like protein